MSLVDCNLNAILTVAAVTQGTKLAEYEMCLIEYWKSGFQMLASPIDRYFIDNPEFAVPAIIVWTLLISALLYKFASKRFSLFFGLLLINCAYTTMLMLAYLIKVPSVAAIISSVLGVICFWGLLFHLLAYRFGPHLTVKFGQKWVKAIDYPYLVVGALGILRIALSGIPAALGEWEVVAVGLVGVALALRITKTSIEVFDLDKGVR